MPQNRSRKPGKQSNRVTKESATSLQDPERFREVFERSSVGLIIFDLEGAHREFNERAQELLGCTKADLGGKPLAELLPCDQHRAALRSLVVLRRLGRASLELSLRRKNGRRVHLKVSASRLGHESYIGLISDVSEERAVEQSLRRSEESYRNLVTLSPCPTAVFTNNRLALTNHAFRKDFSWLSESTLPSLTISDFFGKNNIAFVKEARSLLVGSQSVDRLVKREVTFEFPDGSTHDYDVSATPAQFENKPGLLLTFVDITDHRRLVRQVEQSEAKYRQLIENSVDAVSLSRDDKFLFANAGFLSMFGYSSLDEVVGNDITMVIARKDRKVVLDRSRRRAEGESVPDRYEYHGMRKDHSPIEVEVQVSIIQADGKPTSLAYHRNITERKLADADIQRRTRVLEAMREISLSVNQTIHLDDVLRTGLHMSLKALQCELGGVYRIEGDGSTLTLAIHEGLSERLVETLASQHTREGITGYAVKTMAPVVVNIGDYPPHLPYKGLFEGEGLTMVAYVPLVSKGAVAAVMMLGTMKSRERQDQDDILLESISTQLGVAIENATLYSQIKESEERYRSAVENISDIIYHAAPNGTPRYISPNIEKLVGYSPQDFYRSADLWRTLLHPDDRPQYSRRIADQSLGSDTLSIEYRMLPKGKATYRWVRDSVSYKRDEHGNVLHLTGLLSDITDRVNLENALVSSEELKTNVLASVREGVVVYDAQLLCLDWNSAMTEITGIPRDAVVGKNLADTPGLIGLDELRPLIRQALHGKEASSEDIPLTLSKEIEPRYIWARYSPLLDEQGSIRGVVGIITDVTGRRRLETEARESEQILRNVIDGMGDALMICDLQGKVWEVNREFSRITGLQRSKVLGMDFPYPWLMEEEMARFVTWIAALRERNELRDFDMTWKRENDQTVAMSLNTTLLRNALGEPVAMLNIARDISDRQRLALELEKKNSQIELLNRIISKANSTIDFTEIFSTISNEVFNLVPYDQINVSLLSEDREHLVVYACYSPIGKSVPTGEVIPLENTVSRVAIARQHGVVMGHVAGREELSGDLPPATEGFESQIAIPVFVNERVLGTFTVSSLKRDTYTLEQLRYLQPIADQIGAMIDRVRLFQRVSDDSKYIHNLLNSINSVVYTADSHNRITEVNKAWHEFSVRLGLERYRDANSLIGVDLWEIVPQPELRASFKRVMPQLFERKLEYYSQEYEIRWNGEQRTYHLSLNPMVINDRVTGLVFIHTDITDIKRTEAEIKRRNKELVALNAISTSISKSLHLDEVLRVAAEQIKEIAGADLVLFYLRNQRGNELVLSRSLGLPDRFTGSIGVLPAAESISGTVISGGKPMLIDEGVSSDARVTREGREVFAFLGIDSLAAIPLQSKDKVLGAMDVAFSGRHKFDEREQQLLLLIGNQIGPAIENAILYREIQEQVQRITSLYTIGKGLTGVLDVEALFEVVHTEVSHVIPFERFLYGSYAGQPGILTTIFEVRNGQGYYYHTPLETPPALKVAGSVFEDTLVQGKPWLGQPADEEFKKGSMMAVPVRSKQKIVGLLCLVHSSPDTYNETHLRLLESIANLTEIALDKALLYADTINKSIEIQNRNKELDDFTYVVSHDLKEPLISIEGYSKILLKDYKDRVDEDGREYLGTVVQSSGRMKDLIDDLLTLSRLGRAAEAVQSVSVADTVNEIVRDLQFTLNEKGIRLVMPPELPEVQYNRTQLGMVFRNLIANAMKFNDKPDPSITIGVNEEAGEYVFSVGDNGIGIEEQYFDRIFMIFQRLQRSEEFRGTGAGLTIVKKIVENHRGRIWLESVLGSGTTFYFTVPKIQPLPEPA